MNAVFQPALYQLAMHACINEWSIPPAPQTQEESDAERMVQWCEMVRTPVFSGVE